MKRDDKILLVPVVKGILLIPVEAIIRIEASSNYSKVFCKDQSLPIVVAKVLRCFEDKLPQHLFAGVHRTHLVNKMYMVSIKNNNILLESGMQISISRRKMKKCFADF